MKKTFYLMRHGQTLFNLRRKIQGACDSPLTELGIKQAQAVGKYFKDIELDYAYSSTSERSSDTLEYIIGQEKSYTRLKGLKEMNFGTFEGESEDLNPKDRVVFGTFFLSYGGESRAQVQDRMVRTCTEIMEKDDHNTVLAVSHAGACFHFLSHWQDPSEEIKKGFPNCCIFKYEYEDGNFTLIETIRDAADIK
ncbi:histidine phosphatase family protein [Sebaldella sp. S0638]|uniref:histidine phosphatase family protein n=1 Tax=Sebaldella sp. S0638 TaxID=2957809 RepID=UPI00209D63CE|nr:histidine phosphatase family protein [Sebaldella sp. S0638]MCP1224208.1 histidine phosphatase family protein [Sebaldella sp. S0638]